MLKLAIFIGEFPHCLVLANLTIGRTIVNKISGYIVCSPGKHKPVTAGVYIFQTRGSHTNKKTFSSIS